MSQYNDPLGGSESSIGTQIRTDYFQKKALIEAKKEQFFSQLADVTSMPKNMGKKIKRYHYLPLLDDANINDEGIDANESSANKKVSIPVLTADGSIPEGYPFQAYGAGVIRYIIGEGATAAAAADAAIVAFIEWAGVPVAAGGLGVASTAGTNDLKFAELLVTGAMTGGDVSAYDSGYRFVGTDGTTHVDSTTIDALAVAESGNLYGSSKDVGTISGKIPALSESGGRVNRVGFKRIEIEGSIEKFGFFDEYTQESLDFDSDAELEMHITREAVMGANEITEDALQIDLLNGAGVIRYAGDATSTATMSGEGTVDEVSYGDLMRLSIDLDNNRTPKNTKIITGSRMIDTKTIDAARYLYCGSELIPTIKEMKDLHSNQAFISVQQYGSAGSLAVGEIGSIDQFRIIIVPEMMHWAAAGAAVGTNVGYRESEGNYDVFPMLVVGSGSFTTIGFQTDGKTVKFKITHKKPGPETADSYNDPYGEMGFYSIKWYYGTMILRSERLALIKTVAQW